MYINVIRATIISPFKAAIIKILCRNYMGASSVSTTEKWEFSLSLWIFWLLVQTRNIRGKETGKCSLFIWTSKNFENPHVKALKNMYLCDRSCTYNSPSVSVPLEETKLPFWNVRRRYIDSTFSNLLLIGDHHFSRGSEILNWETDLMTVRSPLPFLSLTILEFAGL